MADFEQVYATYFDAVFKYICGLSGDEVLAEEITAETFFRAMRAIDSFRGECDIRVWLCQIAKNRYYTHLKRHARTESLDDTLAATLQDPEAPPDEAAARAEELLRIRRILHRMAEPYREVFLWRVYAGLSFREIGEMFGKSENWACVTYHRARAKIKQELEGRA